MIENWTRARRNAALAIAIGLLLWLAWQIRAVLNPLLLGYLVAYILHPMVQKLERRGLSRRAAVNLIFLLGFASLVGMSFGILSQARSLTQDVFDNELVLGQINAGLDRTRLDLQTWMAEYLPNVELPSIDELRGEIGQFLSELDREGFAAAGQASTQVAEEALSIVVGALALLLLVPLYTYFMLFQLGRVHGFVQRYLPRNERERIVRTGTQVGEVLANFFRGRLLVAFLKGGFLTVGLVVADVPYAFLFGMGGGFLGLIPVIGPFTAFALATVTGTLDHGFTSSLVRNSIVFGLGEVLEGYVLIPKVLGDSLGMHPIMVIFVLMAGGVALGMFGVLIALPLAATLVILVREYLLPALERLASEGEAAPPSDAAEAGQGPRGGAHG